MSKRSTANERQKQTEISGQSGIYFLKRNFSVFKEHSFSLKNFITDLLFS